MLVSWLVSLPRETFWSIILYISIGGLVVSWFFVDFAVDSKLTKEIPDYALFIGFFVFVLPLWPVVAIYGLILFVVGVYRIIGRKLK